MKRAFQKGKRLVLRDGLKGDLEGGWLCGLKELIMCKIVGDGIREINPG